MLGSRRLIPTKPRAKVAMLRCLDFGMFAFWAAFEVSRREEGGRKEQKEREKQMREIRLERLRENQRILEKCDIDYTGIVCCKA